MSMEYHPNPPWHVEEERRSVKAEPGGIWLIREYTESCYFILDGNNVVIAMVDDKRNAELIVDLTNKFFDECSNGQDSNISHTAQN